MRKEIIIALIIGISFGLVVAFGVRIAQQSLSSRSTNPSTAKNLTATTDSPQNHTILITSPEAEDIVTDSPLRIIGTTTPLSMISIRTGDEATTGIADDTGTFTLDMSIKPGPNIIVIDSFSPEGEQTQVEFTTVLSSADLSATPSARPTKTETKKP